MINKFLFLFCFVLASCLNVNKQTFNAQKEIQGNWLILYPKHILKTNTQRQIYIKAQDSIVSLFGLKLVSFTGNGEFVQIDSLFDSHGKWAVADTGNLTVKAGGKGFENFKGTVVGVVNDTILVEEMVRMGDENIKLIWHLKKIEANDKGASLFDKNKNLWRQKPLKKENDKEIKDRVIAMLRYYSLYFKVVSEESIYFSPSKVFLPFTYYQHGVGLIGFDNNFSGCFYDVNDASKAYQLIQRVVEDARELEFPSRGNYVTQYSDYFERLANYLE